MKQNVYDNPTFFEGYNKLRNSGVTYNDFIEQPALKNVLPNVKGKYILDLGCGTGGFALECIKNGAAEVIGIDISKNMIDIATKENNHEKISYICSPIEDLNIPRKFDIIVSSLAIHYIENYDLLIKKIRTMLKQNGEFIYSIMHPIILARKTEFSNWIKDKENNKLHFALDNYQDEGTRGLHWYIDGVVMYHRTISTLVNTLIENGLSLEKLIEPVSTPEGLSAMPNLKNEERRPSFIIIKARKL